MASLFIVTTELKPFAWRTGLSQIHGLAVALAESGAWSQVNCVLPDPERLVGLAEPSPVAPRVERGPSGVRFLLTDCGFLFDSNVTYSGGKIVGDLPRDESVWEAFADEVMAAISAHGGGDSTFDVMVVDWPSAPVLKRWAAQQNCRRKVMILDLLPQDAHETWRDGPDHADVLHVPSECWTRLLLERHPELLANAHKIHCLPFGLGDDALGADVNPLIGHVQDRERIVNVKHVAKQKLQSQLGFVCDPDAPVIFARHRISEDDQKNHVGIYFAVEQTLAADPQAQVVLTPIDNPVSTVPFMRTAFQHLSERYPDRLAIGPVDPLLLAQASDMQLYPSRSEPCGLVHLFGMAFGVVPVCSRVGAVPEFGMTDARSRGDRSGDRSGDSFLFDVSPADPLRQIQALLESLRAALEAYRDDPEGWASIRQSAMETGARWTWRNLVEQYVAILGPMTTAENSPGPYAVPGLARPVHSVSQRHLA